MFSPILTDVFNETDLLENSLRIEVASFNVINKNHYNVIYWFKKEEIVPVYFDLKLTDYETPFTDYLKNETGIEAFINASRNSVLQKIYSSETAKTFLPHINADGKFSSGLSTLSKVAFDRNLEIPAQSKCKVSAYINSFSHTELPTTVAFTIGPSDGFEDHWTNEQILSFFNVTKVDTSQLIEEYGELTLKYSGILKVNSFLQDQVELSCE